MEIEKLINKYYCGSQVESLIENENKDKDKCMENGIFIKSFDCKFKFIKFDYRSQAFSLINVSDNIYDDIDIKNWKNNDKNKSELYELYENIPSSEDIKVKYFLTNYRFNSFDLFLKMVKYIEVDYGGQRINKIHTSLYEGDSEVFMKKYFTNLFLCEYHKLEYKFYFNEDVQIKDIKNLNFSFDVYKVNENVGLDNDLKKIEYKYFQVQHSCETYNLNEIKEIPMWNNHPGKEIIIKINDSGNNNENDLFDIMKEIIFVPDEYEYKLKLSRNYKNLYIYDIVENFGKPINFSKIEGLKPIIKISTNNINLETFLINYNLVKFMSGMCGSVY